MSRAPALTSAAQRALAEYMVQSIAECFEEHPQSSTRSCKLEYTLICLIGALGGERVERELRKTLGGWDISEDIPLQGQSTRQHGHTLASLAAREERRAA